MALPHGKYHNLLLQRLPPQMKPIPEEPTSSSERLFAESIIRAYVGGWRREEKPEKPAKTNNSN
jgi:hypothetical protein